MRTLTRSIAVLLAAAVLSPVAMARQSVTEPPNVAATMGGATPQLSLRYDGRLLGDGVVTSGTAAPTPERRASVTESNGAVTQVIKWTAAGQQTVQLSLLVTASLESIAVEVDRVADTLPVVRYAIGESHNRRNRAVYDRQRDWVLSIDAGPAVTVTPAGSTSVHGFRIDASGPEIVLRFRPRYYQKHRALKYFQPWTYQPWKPSVAGWTSWYAFRDRVTQADITETAATLADTLSPYGYEYVQIDDGFQQNPIGVPDHWLTPNSKFPGGLSGLKTSITSKGLKPGLWTNVSFADRPYATAHPEYFVKGSDGAPARGNWVGYVMDGTNPKTLADLVTPVYRALKAGGWQYFKVDALRHLKYEGYNSYVDYFDQKQQDRDAVFRQFASSITRELGPDVFKLMCWGVRPELIGLFDGCRLGNDGFGYGGFSEYNSFNNIVWRNDPDHIELKQADAYRATTITSLTGSILMLTDPPAMYRTDRVEAARRASPVLFAVPGQIYDVEPSRSDAISRASLEMSGSGPRTFDATQNLSTHYLYAVDVTKSYEQWMVLARTGGDAAAIRMADLGLAADQEYIGFEFWTKAFLGTFQQSFTPPAIDPRFGVQAICLRPRLAHPQLVATNRHVSCGAMDVSDVTWRARALDGVGEAVANDPYEVYLTEPNGFTMSDVRVAGGTLLSSAKIGPLRVLRLTTPRNGRVSWHVEYRALADATKSSLVHSTPR